MMILIAAASFLATPIAGLNTDARLGDTTAANFSAMIVPPPPRGPALEAAQGDMAVAAVRRMQSGKVKPLFNTAVPPAIVWIP